MWQSTVRTVAVVDGEGRATAIDTGTTRIIATSGTVKDTAILVVNPVPVNAVIVSPPSPTIAVGEMQQFTAQVTDANGNPLNRTVTWTTSNPSVATVNMTTGLATGVAPGSATITGTSNGITGTATITVTPVPVALVTVTPGADTLHPRQNTTLTATVKDASGNTLTGRTVVWSTLNPSVASVGGSSGTVTALDTGTAIISATSEGHSGTATIRVTPVPVATVDVTPSADTLTLGSTVQLTATPRDAAGGALTGRVVSWDSDNQTVATVNGSGKVTTHTLGDANITATVEGRIGVSAIHVVECAGSQRDGEPLRAACGSRRLGQAHRHTEGCERQRPLRSYRALVVQQRRRGVGGFRFR